MISARVRDVTASANCKEHGFGADLKPRFGQCILGVEEAEYTARKLSKASQVVSYTWYKYFRVITYSRYINPVSGKR